MAVQCSPFASTSFPCRSGDGNASSIAYRAAKMNPRRTAPLTDEEIEAEMLGSYLTMRKFRRAVFIDWKNDGVTPHKAAASSGGMAMFSRISAPVFM